MLILCLTCKGTGISTLRHTPCAPCYGTGLEYDVDIVEKRKTEYRAQHAALNVGLGKVPNHPTWYSHQICKKCGTLLAKWETGVGWQYTAAYTNVCGNGVTITHELP